MTPHNICSDPNSPSFYPSAPVLTSLALGLIFLAGTLTAQAPQISRVRRAEDPASSQRLRRFGSLHAASGVDFPRDRVLFDRAHGETAGNADWTIEGGYSDWADDLTHNGFLAEEHRDGPITMAALQGVSVFVLPEPNVPFRQDEIAAILQFVEAGGGLYLIADHAGADRNADGWDAVRILNEFCGTFGFRFDESWYNDDPMTGAVAVSDLTRGVSRLGAWGGTSISILDPAQAESLALMSPRVTSIKMAKGKKGPDGRTVSQVEGSRPFVVCSRYGAGRVVGIGDSSPYDDGSGDPRDKLHDGYNRILFDFPLLAYNTTCWLAGKSPGFFERGRQKTVAWWGESPSAAAKGAQVVIDAFHGNADADRMEEFSLDVERAGGAVYYNRDAFDLERLSGIDVLIISDPTRPFTADEKAALALNVERGMGLFVSCRSDYNDEGHPEAASELIRDFNLGWRFNDDQVVDRESHAGAAYEALVSVTDRATGMEGVNKVLFSGGCSLVRTMSAGETTASLLLESESTAQSLDQDGNQDALAHPASEPIPLMVSGRIRSGVIVISGALVLSDVAYGDFSRQGSSQMAPDTRIFNLRLLELLGGASAHLAPPTH